MAFINAIDRFLPGIFEKIANPAVDWFMVFVSKLGDAGFVWILLILCMVLSKKYRKMGLVAAISLAACYLLGNHILKPIIGRIRPCNLYPDLRILIPPPSDFSFPSMHTATAFSVATVIALGEKKMGACAIVLSFFIAISRVYLNVHYTTDIICGAVFGVGMAIAVCFFIRKTKINFLNY